VFFYVVNVGALQNIAQGTGAVDDFKAFQLPVAIIFAVTGVSRASALVTDIQNGYFDRLLLTPVRRPMLLFGLMAADLTAVVLLAVPVTLLGLVIGVEFVTGLLGILAFLLYGALWGLAFAGFPYSIALKTGNPAAVNASFILFFPFAFLTTTFLPEEAMTGWLATIAKYNPVTYVLEGMRALISEGWVWSQILPGLAAIAVVIAVSFGLASLAMRGRIRRG
jgi:ABC-2 type transport system permease protein